MIIISKYHDYYDDAIGYGVDKSIVYMRKQKEIELQTTDLIRKRLLDIIGKENMTTYRMGHDIIRPFFIGFCGKIYRGYSYSPYSRNMDRSNNIYGFEKAAFPKYSLFENAREEYGFTKRQHTTLSEILDKNDFVKENIKFFQDNKVISFFFEDNHNSNYIINPKLTEFNFQKIMKSADAFQEISMFISDVLGIDEKETIVISEHARAIKHNFDKKTFIKEPLKV